MKYQHIAFDGCVRKNFYDYPIKNREPKRRKAKVLDFLFFTTHAQSVPRAVQSSVPISGCCGNGRTASVGKR